MAYHLRVSIKRENSEELIKSFVSSFEISKYLFCFEVVKNKDKDDNEHIHGHIEYNKIPAKQTISDFFKKLGYSGKYYHKDCIKDEKNKLYVLKGMDIIKHNLEEDELNELLDETNRINDEKEKPMKEQLLNYFGPFKSQLMEVRTDVAREKIMNEIIDDYHVFRDYLPPSLGLRSQYQRYLALKLGIRAMHLVSNESVQENALLQEEEKIIINLDI